MENNSLSIFDTKEWSVKITLSRDEFKNLKKIAYELDISMKKLVNKSIKFAIRDYEDKRYIRRTNKIVFLEQAEKKIYSVTIKEKYYFKLKELSNDVDLNIKELVRCIISIYPNEIEVFENKLD